jgi:hypothetical protein
MFVRVDLSKRKFKSRYPAISGFKWVNEVARSCRV